MMAVTLSEALNLRIFAHNVATVVFLNGMILFVAGLAIIRAHNRWSFQWPVAVTLMGWSLAALGLFRMFAPEQQPPPQSVATLAGIFFVFAIGCFLTFKAYVPEARANKDV